LASRTVRDLIVGSDIRVKDRGMHSLRGSTPPSVGSGLAGLWSGESAT
jgi:hypothetical protein